MSAESMSAGSPQRDEHYLRVWRRHFRDWRGARPFWAGLLTLLGGIPIAYFPYASLKLGQMTLSMSTTAGAGALIIGVLLVALGLTMWFQYVVRVFAGIAAILLALVSIPVANLGGFVIGFLLALTGGALSIAWAPGEAGPAAPAAPPAPAADAQAPAAFPGPRESAEPLHRDPFHKDTADDGNGGRNSAG
ncbi:DUF6114 domain-containing protein [Streptomyces sp. NPDC001941]|uniref:DUF6114 domain-containing protein n=1 Tax=Streptomyces sp. NPDC001941 TaxID=3154659 RepID=UPI00331C2E0F